MEFKRVLTKANYLIHTDAIKDCIIPTRNYSRDNEWIAYSDEADLLNVALFSCTAKDWRDANPEHVMKGLHIRDFASINELVVMANLESVNAIFIRSGIKKAERFMQLRQMVTNQLKSLDNMDFMKSIKRLSDDAFINKIKPKDK